MSYEHANITRMRGYVYGEQPQGQDAVKLDTNENPYPPSAAVAVALAAFNTASLRRHPPATARTLRGITANRFGVEPDQVVVTNGGDEGVRLTLTTFVDPGATFGRLRSVPLTMTAKVARQANPSTEWIAHLLDPAQRAVTKKPANPA